MPPFQSNATVPVPAPKAPSRTGPSRAASIAAMASAGFTRRARMSLRKPSLVSPTTALTERTSSLPGWRSVQSIIPAAASGTLSVLVSRIGVSISPSSLIWVEPMNLP
jgi:hypothetical protein